MKLLVMIIIYVFTEIIGLSLLYGPLRRIVDPDRKHAGRAVWPVILAGILFAFPLIGAVTPDGPVCWFFQKWGNIFTGYMIYFFSLLLIVRLAEFLVRLVRRQKTHEKQTPSRAYCMVLLLVLFACTVAINVSGSATAHDVRTTFYEVPCEVLGQEEPLRIVLIGDTHIGVNSSPQLYRDGDGKSAYISSRTEFSSTGV